MDIKMEIKIIQVISQYDNPDQNHLYNMNVQMCPSMSLLSRLLSLYFDGKYNFNSIYRTKEKTSSFLRWCLCFLFPSMHARSPRWYFPSPPPPSLLAKSTFLSPINRLLTHKNWNITIIARGGIWWQQGQMQSSGPNVIQKSNIATNEGTSKVTSTFWHGKGKQQHLLLRSIFSDMK